MEVTRKSIANQQRSAPMTLICAPQWTLIKQPAAAHSGGSGASEPR
jgi:hypothetical protein